MHPAVLFSLLILWLNLTIAVAQFAIARAPGWRSTRAFGFIALSAACYGAGNVVFMSAGLPDAAYVAAARWNYFWAAIHVVAWYPYAFGGADGSWRAMPPLERTLATAIATSAGLFAFTGGVISTPIAVIPIPWAHLTYHYATTTAFGDVYGTALLALLFVPLVRFFRRWRQGEHDLGLVVVGFALFVVSTVVELAVANGWLVTCSPAELGFLAVVAPTALRTLRRFLADAHRLRELTDELEDEVRERTAERDRAESALLESERLAALGRLAAGVGHEINNPLTYLQLSLDQVDEHLAGSGAGADARASLGHARDAARRIGKVVEGLRTISRRQDEQRPLRPGDVVRAALQVAHPHLRHVARVGTSLDGDARIRGDEAKLVQALVNLLVNAAQAVAGSGGAGRIDVRVAARAAGEVTLEVEDDGPGMPAEVRAHVAEPYFTTRAPQGGLGLGLFLTRGIVAAHGGRLELDSAEGRGTVARIVLPVLDGPPEPADGEPAAEAAPARGPAAPGVAPHATRARLLVVDDEPLVLELLTGALARRWEVAGAAGGEEALARLADGRFDAIVCDLMMPGLSGMEVAERVAESDPALRARMVFLTGGAVTPEAEAFVERPDVTCVNKPFDLAELESLLEAAARRRADG